METYEKRFNGYLEKDIDADTIEAMYSSAMEAIKADPSGTKTTYAVADKTTYKKPGKLTLEERKQRVAEKKAERAAKLAAALEAAGDEEDEE